MQIKEELKNILSKSVKKINYEINSSQIIIDEPPNPSLGDYSSTISLILGRKYSKNPKDSFYEPFGFLIWSRKWLEYNLLLVILTLPFTAIM